MILFGLRDIGAVNTCLPVILILKNKSISVSIYAEGAAYDRLKDKCSLIPECKMNDLFDSTKPTLVVATCATVGGSVPIILTREAKKRNLPVVLLVDIWQSYGAFVWDIFPDSVCVMDEFGKSLILDSWSNYPEARIHVTGMPVFDKFVNVQIELIKHQLRETLGLKNNWPVVFFAGQAWGMSQAVKMFIETLNNFKYPVYLILTDHPAVVLSGATDEFKKIHTEYKKELNNLRRGMLVDPGRFTSNEILAGSDIVIGIFSTMTVEACHVRKPVLIISTPEINRLLAKATNNILNQWPLINLGAALKAENIDEINTCLRKIIDGDTANMREAQQRHFQADGLSADRIANVILSYY